MKRILIIATFLMGLGNLTSQKRGSLDETFNQYTLSKGERVYTTHFGSFVDEVGNIYTSDEKGVVKLFPNGEIDTQFISPSLPMVKLLGGSEMAKEIFTPIGIEKSTGKIWVEVYNHFTDSGSGGSNGSNNKIIKLNPNGTQDLSFKGLSKISTKHFIQRGIQILDNGGLYAYIPEETGVSLVQYDDNGKVIKIKKITKDEISVTQSNGDYFIFNKVNKTIQKYSQHNLIYTKNIGDTADDIRISKDKIFLIGEDSVTGKLNLTMIDTETGEINKDFNFLYNRAVVKSLSRGRINSIKIHNNKIYLIDVLEHISGERIPLLVLNMDGSMDKTFNSDETGLQRDNFKSKFPNIKEIHFQPNGKIILNVFEYSSYYNTILDYNYNGKLLKSNFIRLNNDVESDDNKLGNIESNNWYKRYFILNPVKDNLIIKTDAKVERIEIYNTAGRLVKVLFKVNTNVQDLPKGIYLIKITTDQGVRTEKIIKG